MSRRWSTVAINDCIHTWQITAGSNCAGIVARRDEELIWLTLKAAEAVRRINPNHEIIVGIAQPWGDYLAEQERNKTPFVFADDLLRTGIKLAALDLEIVMGISPRGSYCRDLLEAARMLELYMLLGVPIQATLGYPSSSAVQRRRPTRSTRQSRRVLANGLFRRSAGRLVRLTATCLWPCASRMSAPVQWAHWSDAQPHTFPHCGLIDEQGREKPALAVLRQLRADHLR